MSALRILVLCTLLVGVTALAAVNQPTVTAAAAAAPPVATAPVIPPAVASDSLTPLSTLFERIIPKEPSLLGLVQLIWIAINSLVLLSPFIGPLAQAGAYGKLRGSSDDSTQSIFLHPSLYVRTSTAFIGYYVFACLWNGALFAEVLVSQ